MIKKNLIVMVSCLLLGACTIKVYHSDMPPPPLPPPQENTEPAQPLTPEEKAQMHRAAHDAKVALKKCVARLKCWHEHNCGQSS